MSEKQENDKVRINNLSRMIEPHFEDAMNPQIITYEMMHERRLNYKEYPLSILHKGVSLIVLFVFTYPLYTEFLRRRITSLEKNIKREDFKFHKIKLFGKGGMYIGFPVFFWSKFLPYFILENLRMTDKNYFFSITFFNIIGYPLMLNANMRALKMKEALKFNGPRNILILYFSRSSYKGGMYYLFHSLLFYCPILNYFCHYLESTRLAYTLGPYFGHNFKTMKETRINLNSNNLLNRGRFYFNFQVHLFNFYVISSLSLKSSLNET